MQKITFEDYPSTNTPIDAQNLNQVQTNVENAITSLGNSINTTINTITSYSTTEKIVGTWLNGENVYRKVINTGEISQADKSVAHGISNLDKIIKIDGMAISSNGFYMLPRITTGSSQNFVGIKVSSTNVDIICGSAPIFSDSWVILEYTKSS